MELEILVTSASILMAPSFKAARELQGNAHDSWNSIGRRRSDGHTCKQINNKYVFRIDSYR